MAKRKKWPTGKPAFPRLPSLSAEDWERLRVKIARDLEVLQKTHAEAAAEWESEFGEPFPQTVEDWEQWLAIVDAPGRYLPAEKTASGDWTGADILNFIQGYLIDLRNKRCNADRPSVAPEEPYKHSDDFRSIKWNQNAFTFTRNQARCVKLLWQAWKNDTPEIDGLTVVTQADVSQNRLVDVFKGKDGMHPAWNTLIVSGATKGSYRLADSPIIVENRRRKQPRKTPRKTPR